MLPPAHGPVQRVAPARFGPSSATFVPCGNTAPRPRPARGHGTGPSITERTPCRRRRPLPPRAATDNPPAPTPPPTAPSQRAPARWMPDHGSRPAPDAFPSTWNKPESRSRTPAPATEPRSAAADRHVDCHHRAEPAAAHAPAAPPAADATRRRRRSPPPRPRRPRPTPLPTAAPASATCPVLTATSSAFFLHTTRHHPRAQPRRRRQHPVKCYRSFGTSQHPPRRLRQRWKPENVLARIAQPASTHAAQSHTDV
jgi:hypothetical protein